MTGHFLLLVDPMSVDVDGLNFCITTILAFAHFSNNFLIPALNIIITCLILAFRTAKMTHKLKQRLRIVEVIILFYVFVILLEVKLLTKCT